MARAALTITVDALILEIGWRASASISRNAVENVAHASWRDIPDGSQTGYVNLAKPTEPNVLIACSPPADVRLFGAIKRPVRLIGLHVDDPDALILLMKPPRAG